jgi:hypothetical protein
MFALLGATFGVTACDMGNGSSAEGAGNGSGATATSQTTAQPLVVLETGSTLVKVFEDHPGDVLVAEEGAAGMDSVLDGWNGRTSTLMDMYKTVAPKLKKPLSADMLKSLGEADVRIESLRKEREAQQLQSSSPIEVPIEEQGPSGPNFYDYAGDLSWWRGNFCRPGTWCTVWNTWSHSGRRTDIANWNCTVMNASEFGTANLTLWQKVCSGIFCSTVWAITRTNTLGARQFIGYHPTASTSQGVECMGDGVNGTLVNVGLYWQTPIPPAPPPPAPSCGPYIYRAQTNGCTNGTNGSASGLKICADGCGSTPEQAQANAAAVLSTRVCLGSAWGCCNVTYDQNFNWCGY